MFYLALGVGVLSYLILFLGFAGLLYPIILHVLGAVFIIGAVLYTQYACRKQNVVAWLKKRSRLEILIICLMAVMCLINFVGALSPELAFDALWYHLTFPKLYLQHHAIYYISGGLLYYSVMPKLAEGLYTIPLSFCSEVFVKVVHFLFGIGILFAVYKLARLYLPAVYALLAVLLFASNLVFMWESTTAYIDLVRTFFEILALWSFLLWSQRRIKKYLVIASVLVGLAAATKVLALGSVGILVLLILVDKKISWKERIIAALLFAIIAFLVPLPWFVFAFIYTGNPVYPFFSGYDVTPHGSLISPVTFVTDVLHVLLFADDPISPMYILIMPLVLLFYKKFPGPVKMIINYSGLAILVWYITPRTGGGRFLLPYLPAFSIVAAAVIEKVKQRTFVYSTLVTVVCIVSLTSILYRGIAEKRYIPVLLHTQSKQQFLSDNLNYSFGDFYDTDGYFAKHITHDDMVLLFGFHNIYYVDFPFIDSTWVKKGDRFNYVATQHVDLPERFSSWKEVYTNPKTGVRLYTNQRRYVQY